MKKIILSLSVLALAACSGIKKDAQRLADIQCQAKELQTKLAGLTMRSQQVLQPTSIDGLAEYQSQLKIYQDSIMLASKEMTELALKAKEVETEILNKYTDEKSRMEFQSVLLSATNDCKN